MRNTSVLLVAAALFLGGCTDPLEGAVVGSAIFIGIIAGEGGHLNEAEPGDSEPGTTGVLVAEPDAADGGDPAFDFAADKPHANLAADLADEPGLEVADAGTP